MRRTAADASLCILYIYYILTLFLSTKIFVSGLWGTSAFARHTFRLVLLRLRRMSSSSTYTPKSTEYLFSFRLKARSTSVYPSCCRCIIKHDGLRRHIPNLKLIEGNADRARKVACTNIRFMVLLGHSKSYWDSCKID